MSYYLQDNPNPNTPQFGWYRKKVSGAIGVHTAENNTDFEGADPGAEDVARFIGRRTDYGSYHSIADADSRIKLIHPSYAAWADTENNAHGMSVSGAMQAARWRELTPARAAAITRNMAYAAAELVQDAIAARLLDSPVPARRITPAEAIAGSKAGFYGHGETNPGRRYDPGQNFDWNLFLSTYASAIGGIATQGTTTTPVQEDDMAQVPQREWDEMKLQMKSVVDNVVTDKKLSDALEKLPLGVWSYQNPELGGGDAFQILRDALASTNRLTDTVSAAAAKAAAGGADEATIKASVKEAITELLIAGASK